MELDVLFKILGNRRNFINKDTYLRNSDGELLQLKYDYCVIYEDKNFKLYNNEGEIFLQSFGTKNITKEYLRELDELLNIKFAIERIILQ